MFPSRTSTQAHLSHTNTHIAEITCHDAIFVILPQIIAYNYLRSVTTSVIQKNPVFTPSVERYTLRTQSQEFLNNVLEQHSDTYSW
jgi:hypothetical protein